MLCLSVRQPWAWAILNAGKRIENRERKDGRMPAMCRYRGPLLIHAAKGCTGLEYQEAAGSMVDAGLVEHIDAWDFEAERAKAEGRIVVPRLADLARGGIGGACNVVGHVDPSGQVFGDFDATTLDRRWHKAGSYGLVLANVRPLPFVPFKGALGLFDVPDDLVPEAFSGDDSAAKRGSRG